VVEIFKDEREEIEEEYKAVNSNDDSGRANGITRKGVGDY